MTDIEKMEADRLAQIQRREAEERLNMRGRARRRLDQIEAEKIDAAGDAERLADLDAARARLEAWLVQMAEAYPNEA